jgi:hypothetical protein
VLLAANLALVIIAIVLLNLHKQKKPLKKFPLTVPGGFAVKDISARRPR